MSSYKTPSNQMITKSSDRRPPSVQDRRNQGSLSSGVPTAKQGCLAFAFEHGAGRDTARSRRMKSPTPSSASSSRNAVCSSKSEKGEEVTSKPRSMKKGGMVKKTGIHYLHKGEMVVPVKDVKKVKKALAKKT